TYTIEEGSRAGRDRLRKELGLLGWAPLSASTWISPTGDLGAVRRAAEAGGVAGEVHLFCGAYRGPLHDRELVAGCWDLARIAGAYEEFIAFYEPRLRLERESDGLDDTAAFVERLWLLHDYRKFAYLDPGLPSELVPAHWPGTRAAGIFRSYYGQLGSKSQRYFARVAGV
ncbi:MAG TPA: PaaX family transcriptional regulator C-terminal domain-containing protein, partial [Candidatus Tumulicola sp.]|nr:PaaX family transcriptional regulator C-terminal domain-containing protein [Candidatus Tumulicola sp.]